MSLAKYQGCIYDSILETVGATPLVRLPRLKEKYGITADIMAKCEFFNPLSSVKDRIGLSMIEAAEAAGTITAGKTVLIEATAGNTGIGLAFVAASKGYHLILVMPDAMSVERRKMFKHLGAELVLTPAEIGMAGAIERAHEIAAEHEEAYILRQFSNPENPNIHERTNGVEIWEDTKGAIDIFVSVCGTGGVITGVSRALKTRNPDIKTYAVEPAHSAFLSGDPPQPQGLQGMGNSFMPDILDVSLIDDIIKVDEQACFDMAREAACLEGIPAGISSGASLLGLIEIARRPENHDKTIVTILSSSAERYISTALFESH